MSSDGLASNGSVGDPLPGDRYELTTSSGAALSGVIESFRPPKDFVATVDGLNGALLRVHLDEFEADRPFTEFVLSVSAWSAQQAAVRDVQEKLEAMVDTLFGDERIATQAAPT